MRLKERVMQFQQHVKDRGLFTYFESYPVFYTPHNGLSQAIENTCVLSSFPYPNPDSEPVTRVVLNALHREEDISILAAEALNYVHSIEI
jgi:8-amino-7-oxononanoate synthase